MEGYRPKRGFKRGCPKGEAGVLGIDRMKVIEEKKHSLT